MKEQPEFNRELYKAILVCDLRSSFYYSQTVSLSQNFKNISVSIKTICDIVDSYGGIIDGFAGDGVLSVFTSPKHALLCAEKIIDSKTLFTKVGVALHYGKIQICELGNNVRKCLTALSSEVNKTFKIEKINKKIGSNLIFTKQFLNSLPMGNYNFRYIGTFMCDDATDKLALFEYINNKKFLQNKLTFENAVRNYEKGDYLASKGDFLTVLKGNSADKVAKYYLSQIKKINE